MGAASAERFRNWAGNQSCTPAAVDRPATEDELALLVKEASAAGQRVKVVGSGHSFSGAALTDGRLVRLDRYRRVLSADPATGLVEVQAGITLAGLNDELARRGLALENLGDIAYQTISGAISTSTHGTGGRLGTLSTQVRRLRLVAGDGSVLECSPTHSPEVFAAACVGVGALGAISTVTLQAVPAFRLRTLEEPRRLSAVLESLEETVAAHDHFELFWVPHTGWALTKTADRTEEPLQPRDRWTAFRDDVLFSNVAFGAACRIGRWRPSLVPRLARALPGTGRAEHVERSDRWFASPRLVRFTEMEYAIPRHHAAEAVRAVRDYAERSGLLLSFPVEVRFGAADRLPLSPAYGRDTGWVAVHVYRGVDGTQYFLAVESIMRELGGRPHWGKLHYRVADDLARAYPRWDDWQAVRRRLDPEGTFANEYTDRVLGRVT